MMFLNRYTKIRLIIIGLILGQIANAQTQIENKLLVALNKYRLERDLVSLNYNSQASEIALNEATYLSRCLDLDHNVHNDVDKGHDQKFDIPGHLEKTFDQRANSVKGVQLCGEIIYPTFIVNAETDETSIVNGIIQGFHKSINHRQIMSMGFPKKHPRIKPIAGISVIRKEDRDLADCIVFIVVIDLGWVEIQ